MAARIVFMGSPEFAVPILKALEGKYQVVGVVTQPDRPAGRGRELKAPPIKIVAKELGLPFIQPQRLREAGALEQMRAWQPDIIVVAAFGQILRAEVLEMPRYGCINVHASLLPRWRGAAPVQAAILNGDEVTGITIMRMDAGVDTGPTLSQAATPIHPEDTGGTLSERLAELGAELLLDTLPKYLSGELATQEQDDTRATYAPLLKKEDGELDFAQPAESLARGVRAFNPWPGAFINWQGQILKIHKAHAIDYTQGMDSFGLLPGKAVIFKNLPALTTSEGLLVLDILQPAGKKAMAGEDFLRGARGWTSEDGWGS